MYQSGILLYENTSFSKSWKSVMVGTTEVKLPMKIRFSNRDILSKKCQGCVITMIIPRSIMIFSIYQWKSIFWRTQYINLEYYIMRTQVSQNFEKVSWLVLQKSNYHWKSDFPTMTFCPKKCHSCVITMTFLRSTMTFSNYQ